MNVAAFLEPRPAELEVILAEPDQSFRWYQHDYPFALARWNHHPEYEIHLIRKGSGRLLAGDYVGPFDAGHVAMIGPNLPHDWIGDLSSGEVLEGRDVVIQFSGELLRSLSTLAPELGEYLPLLERARRGLEFTGATARSAAELIEEIGALRGARRLLGLFSLLELLAKAPAAEVVCLASACYAPALDARSSAQIHHAFDYLLSELTEDIRLPVIAQRVGMSEAGFSRFFKKVTGHGFIELARKLRIQRACRLLMRPELSIAAICFEVGYANLSNFNRHFRTEMQQTPSEYRRELTKSNASVEP
ncbi:AraC family transcriptional regulator [Pseudomonas oryzihabitans]|uniref:AraC-like DNA-binding protein n=1 Tax=Pseudomonas oryzihabitans TaxID=47885 RepID=A0AAJ2BUK7_9PSED|nr:AraC family transcriptional regulator [Pseudomonas psychrotolerans]MDR6236827.1 AraC-like DNA-binding protein [Pseudomonas psychrotolerans]